MGMSLHIVLLIKDFCKRRTKFLESEMPLGTGTKHGQKVLNTPNLMTLYP